MVPSSNGNVILLFLSFLSLSLSLSLSFTFVCSFKREYGLDFDSLSLFLWLFGPFILFRGFFFWISSLIQYLLF